jgi:hypothetical protein
LLLAACPDWIYTPPDSDSWLYHGCFFQLPHNLRVIIAFTYPATRLPWTLPGYLLYRILPPQTAYLVLHGLLCYASTLSLYYIVCRAVNRNTALLGGLLFCTHYDFCLVFGTDYVIAPAITYLLLALACLTRAKFAVRPRRWDLAAGGALAAALIVYPSLAAFGPLVLAYALVKHPEQVRPNTWREWFGRTACLTLGGLASLLGFCLASLCLGGEFLFFMPAIRYIFENWDIGHSYRVDWETVLYRAHWLVLPAAATLSGAGLLVLALVRRGKVRGPEVLLAGLGLAACLFFLLKDLEGDCYLQNPWHAGLLLPFVFLGLCAFLLKVPADSHPVWTGVLAAVIPAGSALVMTLAFPWVNPITDPTSRLAGVLALIGVAFLLKLALGRTGLGTVLSGVALLVAYLGAFENPVVGQDVAVLWGEGQHFQRRVDSVLTLLQENLPDEHPLFWFNQDEHCGLEFNSICSAYGWAPSLLNDQLPALVRRNSAWRCLMDVPLVVLSARPEQFPAAEKAMRGLGKLPILLAEKKICAGDQAYWAKLYRVCPGDPLALDPGGALARGDQTPLPADLWRPEVIPPRMRFEETRKGIEVRTLRAPSGYVARYIAVEAPTAGDYVFVVHYRLWSGNLRFGCLDENEKNWLAIAPPDEEHEGHEGVNRCQVVRLFLAAGQRVKPMISNDNPDGRSRFLITGLFAYKIRPPA